MINLHWNKDDIGIIGVEGIPAGSTFLAAFQFPHSSMEKKLPPRSWSHYLFFIFFYFFISQRRSIVKATVNSAILSSVVSLLNFLLLQLVRKTVHKDWRMYVRAKKNEKEEREKKLKSEGRNRREKKKRKKKVSSGSRNREAKVLQSHLASTRVEKVSAAEGAWNFTCRFFHVENFASRRDTREKWRRMFIWILAHSSPFPFFQLCSFSLQRNPITPSYPTFQDPTKHQSYSRLVGLPRATLLRETHPLVSRKNTFLGDSDVFEVSAVEICPLYDTSITPRETEYRVPLMDRSICLVANDMIIETLAGRALVVPMHRSRITFSNNRVRRERRQNKR